MSKTYINLQTLYQEYFDLYMKQYLQFSKKSAQDLQIEINEIWNADKEECKFTTFTCTGQLLLISYFNFMSFETYFLCIIYEINISLISIHKQPVIKLTYNK